MNDEWIEALERCRVLLEATVQFIDRNPIGDYDVYYDHARCDGDCLAVDCGITIDAISKLLARRGA